MSLICEEISIWDRLKNSDKNIYIYGLGLGTQKVLDVCRQRGIIIKNIVISDAQRKIKADTFGFEPQKISSALADENAIILLGFGSQKREVLDYFYYLDDNFEVYSPDVPVFGDGIFDLDYYNKNKDMFEKAYNLLADDISRETYKATLNYKISGKLKYLREFTQHKDEMFGNVLKIGENEHYVDLGAYTGDTIAEVMHYGSIERVTAFEPDVRNFNKMNVFLKSKGWEFVNPINIGVWDREDTLYFDLKASRNSSINEENLGQSAVPVNSVDNIVGDDIVTLIKMDVEGAERKALEGAIKTIQANKPRLNVGIYHRNEDLFDLVLLVHELCPEYKIYIRHHEYVPSWDTNLYATI